MLNESILNELRQQAAEAIAKPVIRFIEVNPQTLLELVEVAKITLNMAETIRLPRPMMSPCNITDSLPVVAGRPQDH